MKKLERNIPGVYDFDEVLDYLHQGIMDMRTNVVWNLIQMQDTVTLAGQWDGRRDGVRCAFRVYEKYIYRRSVALTLQSLPLVGFPRIELGTFRL